MKRKIKVPRSVIFGGSWDSGSRRMLAASVRSSDNPSRWDFDLGFRLKRKL